MRGIVVDDQPTMRRIQVRLLRTCGFAEVLEAENVANALRALGTAPVDLVVTDWNLEGTSGIELVRRLRQQEATHAVPIVMVTSHDTEADVREAIQAGITHYIVKPFSAESFIARIKEVLVHTGHPASD